MRAGTIAVLFTTLLLQCSHTTREQTVSVSLAEPSLEEALEAWPEMPQQITFTGLVNCPTKFQVYWNGAMSCFVGRDCFGNVFPSQQEITRQYEQDQLHMTLAGGEVPDFPVIDSGQIGQFLLDGYLPIVETSWMTGGYNYEVQSLVTALNPTELDPAISAEMSLALMEVSISSSRESGSQKADLWLNFSGYRVLVPTIKELPDDVFPIYGRRLRLENNILLDDKNRIRAAINGMPEGSVLEFHDDYIIDGEVSPSVRRSMQKGFHKNLLHISLPCKSGQKVELTVILPYFPIEVQNQELLDRDYISELEAVRRYWEEVYRADAIIETPDEFVNNFYKSGLWHTLVSADADPRTGMLYAKSSPAWYETMWPNCTMVSSVSMDMRGHHYLAGQYLEPFIEWQSVRDPPNMKGASGKGFLCPPAEFCAIPWVSNHGNILWALCEHYRITGDMAWAERITGTVLQACDWIIAQRRLTSGKEYGSGLLPGGTVSDDKGSGQYLCSDAQNYRGLRTAADFLRDISHERAGEMDLAAARYKEDIISALQKAVGRNDSITLPDGQSIPYVPAEIHQTVPPEFDAGNFWPYINYIDVGPMHLVDCHVLESGSDMAGWILQFETNYQLALLQHPISLRENWVASIRHKGDVPARLLHHGVSTVEPFYSPRSTLFLEKDEVEDYLEIFYHQLASGVSHKNLSPCENRYGVWHMPWADGEFHRMFLRMLVHQQNETLVLMKAIPRRWLKDGEEIHIENQPTEYGILNYHVISNLKDGVIEMTLDALEDCPPGGINIRFRHPQDLKIRRVEVDGKSWDDFQDEYVKLGKIAVKTVSLKVYYL